MQPEIVIDSFAGGGGASMGIEIALQAVGAASPKVDIAINHSRAALAMHAANHPGTLHLESDIWTVDPRFTTRGRPVGLLWASPDCRHFSRTKGQTPVSKKVRGLAWSIAHWAQQVLPRVIMLENVPEFITWGPLIVGPQGHEIPDPARAGETFREWITRFKRLGYRVDKRVLRACDYGAPTSRERLYIVMRLDGEPIVWPAPTHADPASPDVQAGRLLPWITATDIIEWHRPAASIFMSREEARLVGANRPLVDNTMSRLARGVKRFVLDTEAPCIVDVGGETAAVFMTAHYGSDTGSPATVPLRTITGVPKIEPVMCRLAGGALTTDQLAGAARVAELLRAHGAPDGDGFVTVGGAVIVDIGMRGLTPRELARGQGFPPSYVLAASYDGGTLSESDQRHKIGNSVCPPVAAALVRANYRPQSRVVERPRQGWLFESA